MNRGAVIAIGVALLACGSAIVQGVRNQSGASGDAVVLTLGREASLVQGAEGNTGRSVRLRLGPDEVMLAPVTRREWLAAAGFGPAGRLAASRPAYAVLDAGTDQDRGPAGLEVVAIDRNPARLNQQYPDRTRYLISPVMVRAYAADHAGDTLGTVVPSPGLLHVPAGTAIGSTVTVRTGRRWIPYLVK